MDEKKIFKAEYENHQKVILPKSNYYPLTIPLIFIFIILFILYYDSTPNYTCVLFAGLERSI